MDDADEREPPNYAAMVDRELRIADNLVWAERLWAEIFGPDGSLGREGRRQQYTRVRRSR